MKRKNILIVISTLLVLGLVTYVLADDAIKVSPKIQPNQDNNAEYCKIEGGVQICDSFYCCGIADGVCPETYGADCSEINKDPDCSELGCRPDCTDRGGFCTLSCNGEAGCSINESLILSSGYLCQGVKPGVVVDYNSTHEVTCCNGEIRPKIKTTLASSIYKDDVTTVKYTKLVNYKGKPVRLTMIVWG